MNRIEYLVVPALVLAAPAYAATYHTVESAQRACFPDGGEFSRAEVKLTKEQMKTIEKVSGVRPRVAEQKVWRVTKAGALAGWFLVDDVIGKHEFITYALALQPDGSVRSVEVMDYRENYGSEIRQADWRRQFVGQRNGAKLKLEADIKNISGATLSCRHLTEGVKRLLATHDLILKNL